MGSSGGEWRTVWAQLSWANSPFDNLEPDTPYACPLTPCGWGLPSYLPASLAATTDLQGFLCLKFLYVLETFRAPDCG